MSDGDAPGNETPAVLAFPLGGTRKAGTVGGATVSPLLIASTHDGHDSAGDARLGRHLMVPCPCIT